jgi:hypothetical protein
VQLAEAGSSRSALAAQVAALQAALERGGAHEAGLASRLAEVSGQLAAASEAGASLRAQNGELLAELASLRCAPVCAWPCVAVLASARGRCEGAHAFLRPTTVSVC